MLRRIALMSLAALALVAAGCSDDDGGEASGNGDPTVTGPNANLPADCVTRLQVVGAGDQGLPDTPFGAQLVLAQGGNFEGATPEQQQSLDLAIFGEFLPETSGIPEGDPGAPDGGHVLVVHLTSDDIISGDQTFKTGGGDDGTVDAMEMWSGSTELTAGDATVTITYTTNSRVCGSIQPADGEAGVTGTFKAQRLEGPEF